MILIYSKTCLKRSPKKNTKTGFQYRLSLNAYQKYCRMLQGEHSAILLTCIKLPFSIKTLFLSIFKWPLKTGFTVFHFFYNLFQPIISLALPLLCYQNVCFYISILQCIHVYFKYFLGLLFLQIYFSFEVVFNRQKHY